MRWGQAPPDASRPHSRRDAPAIARVYGLLLGIAIAVIGLDQMAKEIVRRTLQGRAPVQVLGGLFQLDYTRNTGAAFSILQSGGWLFAVVAVVVAVGILVYVPRLAGRGWPTLAGLGLVLGGAIGNLVDRVRFGYVVDFIDFRWFPVFNLADSSIVCGVSLLILASLLASESTRS